MDHSQAELEEEANSGPGEGDEIMEEVEEQEGYSASLPCPPLKILRLRVGL